MVSRMYRKTVGPKGEIVIPKQLRDAMGLKPGFEVMIEIKGGEIVITRPKIEGSYTEYYTATNAPKLKKRVKLKEIMNE
jgi:AbrB family looped-hinge helix DNA binding protein